MENKEKKYPLGHKKKVLVTGGAGFIGSHLVDKLIEQHYEVVVIDNFSTGKRGNINSKAKFYNIDILDSKISEIFKKENPEIVCHYAAQINIRKSVEYPIESAKTNIFGSLNILENCKKFGVEKIVFASTGGAIYGETKTIPTTEAHSTNPISPYGIEKLAVENYLNFYKKEYGLNYLVLRFSNVYGPRQNSKGEAGVVAIFCDKMLAGEKVVINGDGKQTRDFVFVDDVVNANILGIEKNKIGIFNAGTGIETDINTIFKNIEEMFGSKIKAIHGEERGGDQKRSCLDYGKVKNEFGWEPKISLEEGLEKTYKWIAEQVK